MPQKFTQKLVNFIKSIMYAKKIHTKITIFHIFAKKFQKFLKKLAKNSQIYV